ncbi:hypothetical protein [Streptomyces sp. bgisy154]
MCRGFVDAYGLPQAAREAIEMGIGHIVEVPDPKRKANGLNDEHDATRRN